jgi:Na+/phosphate symporter
MKVESKSETLRGWNGVMAVAGALLSSAGTALLISLPISWLINVVFAPGAIRAVFGGDRLKYWQCVMMFAIWYCARIKFRFPGTLTGKI